MINRYSRDEMAQIWTEENKFAAWLEVEILATEAWSELGVVPKEDAEALRKNARFDVDRIYEIEKQTRHDVVAFTRTVSESLGEEKKWVHYGLTSTGDDHLKATFDRSLGIFQRIFRRAVCAGNFHFIPNTKFFQNINCCLHQWEIRVTAHDDSDFYIHFFCLHFGPSLKKQKAQGR